MNDAKENDLPDGWHETNISDVFEVVGGGTPPTEREDFWSGNIAWITSADIDDNHKITPRRRVTTEAIEKSAANLVPKGSVIVVTRVGLGKVGIAEEPLCFSQDSQALIFDTDHLDSRFVMHQMSRTVAAFRYMGRGTTISGVTKQQLNDTVFRLAPLNEQHRIVAEIEKQFERLDEGVASLKRVEEDLRHYRASVLKAACEGTLVLTEAALARQEKRTYEPAHVLLQKILKQRRAKWEREQLAKIKAQGKKPRDNKWKDKYVEPEEPNAGYYRPELPDGWTWAGFEQVASFDKNAIKAGPFGSKLKKSVYTSSGYKIYGQEQVIKGDPFYGDYYIDKDLYQELHSCAVKPGDLLISLVGTTGKVLILPKGIEPGIINPRLLKFSLNQKIIDIHYTKFYLESPLVKGYLRLASHGGTMGILNLTILKDLAIPLPPLTEQKRIVAEVEKRLGMIEELEATVSLNLVRAEELRRSILQRAFAGRLVSQDPNDEPASILLERITAEHQRNSEESMKEKKRIPRRKEEDKAVAKLPFAEEKDLLAVFKRKDIRLPIEDAFESGSYNFQSNDDGEYEDVDAFFAQLSELLTQATLTIEREPDQVFLRRMAR